MLLLSFFGLPSPPLPSWLLLHAGWGRVPLKALLDWQGCDLSLMYPGLGQWGWWEGACPNGLSHNVIIYYHNLTFTGASPSPYSSMLKSLPQPHLPFFPSLHWSVQESLSFLVCRHTPNCSSHQLFWMGSHLRCTQLAPWCWAHTHLCLFLSGHTACSQSSTHFLLYYVRYNSQPQPLSLVLTFNVFHFCFISLGGF